MKNKKVLFYFSGIISVGFLIYNYFYAEYGYGMMNHHYGYYNNYSRNSYLLNSGLRYIAYFVLILSAILILKERATTSNTALEILNDRLAEGEISIEEYRNLTNVLKESR